MCCFLYQEIVNLLLNEGFTFSHWFILTIFVLNYSHTVKRDRHAAISGLEDVDIIITDAKIPQFVANKIEEMGIELIIAGS